jgi:hypothetical protein
MIHDGAFILCPACGQRVDPDEPGTTWAAKLLRLDTFGSTEYVEAPIAFFHEGHFRGGDGWREKPRR